MEVWPSLAHAHKIPVVPVIIETTKNVPTDIQTAPRKQNQPWSEPLKWSISNRAKKENNSERVSEGPLTSCVTLRESRKFPF